MVTKKTKPRKLPSVSPPKRKRVLSLWEQIEALGRHIPEEELARIPTDGARNLHHYLHGGPKQD